MMPKYRTEILRGVETMCQLYPSYRLCQMVANTASLGVGSPDAVLSEVTDNEFLRGLRESIGQRSERIGGGPATGYEGDTLPALLPKISEGLRRLSEQHPDQPFVSLVLQIAEWAKEYSPFDFWDVEDADFLRAIQAHLAPSGVAS